jgi:hypothetical protein
VVCLAPASRGDVADGLALAELLIATATPMEL